MNYWISRNLNYLKAMGYGIYGKSWLKEFVDNISSDGCLNYTLFCLWFFFSFFLLGIFFALGHWGRT